MGKKRVSVDTAKTPLLCCHNNVDVQRIMRETYDAIKDVHLRRKRSLGCGVWFVDDVHDVAPYYLTESEIILRFRCTETLIKFVDMMSRDKVTVCVQHDGLHCKQFSLIE